MKTETPKNILIDSYTEFREDLVKQGRNIKLEITAETYEHPIFPVNDAHGEIFSWLFIAEVHEGHGRFEAGHQYYEKQLTEIELREEVKAIKADPFKIMIEHYAKEYEK